MMIVVVVILLALLTAILFWRRLSPRQKQDLRKQLAENARTLLAILAIATLPATFLLPQPEWVGDWVAPVVGLSLWGFFLVAFWDNQVVPSKALETPTKPYRADRAPLPLPTANDTPVVEGDVGKAFHWTFTPQNGQAAPMSVDLTLSSERYREARAEARRPAGDWAHYAERDMPELHALQGAFARLHQNRDWSTLEQASNVLSFTQQCIDYRSDEETTPQAEWPRYPIETLMDEEGDCEDDVILTAAVLKRLGFDVSLLYYAGHCALGVAGACGLPGDYVFHSGNCYFYGETTTVGWHLGEVPLALRGQQPERVEEVKRAED